MTNSCNVNGIRISYEEYGSGEPLVLLMGLGAPGRKWMPHIEAYKDHFHVYAPDNRGAGQSDKPVSYAYTIRDMAEDTIGMMDALGIGSAHLNGISMGGAAVIRFLATEDIPVEKAIIDAGITPYPYPKLICRLISVKDWIMIMLGTRSLRMMKLACPPERWTPKGEDPEEHYRALLKFYKQHYSPRTIYNVFWSTDNYSMPDPVPRVDTKIEYWYGEEEKRAREKEHDIEFVRKAYPQTVLKEFKGLAHAELVMMFPERFAREVKKFLEK